MVRVSNVGSRLPFYSNQNQYCKSEDPVSLEDVAEIDPKLLIRIVTLEPKNAETLPLYSCYNIANLYFMLRNDLFKKLVPRDPESRGIYSDDEFQKIEGKFLRLHDELDHNSESWKLLDKVYQSLLNMPKPLRYPEEDEEEEIFEEEEPEQEFESEFDYYTQTQTTPDNDFGRALSRRYGLLHAEEEEDTLLNEVWAVLQVWSSPININGILSHFAPANTYGIEHWTFTEDANQNNQIIDYLTEAIEDSGLCDNCSLSKTYAKALKDKLSYIALFLADKDVIEEIDAPKIIDIAIRDEALYIIEDLMNNNLKDKINVNYIRSKDVDFAEKVKDLIEVREKAEKDRYNNIYISE